MKTRGFTLRAKRWGAYTSTAATSFSHYPSSLISPSLCLPYLFTYLYPLPLRVVFSILYPLSYYLPKSDIKKLFDRPLRNPLSNLPLLTFLIPIGFRVL